jgi:hypothetical protein
MPPGPPGEGRTGLRGRRGDAPAPPRSAKAASRRNPCSMASFLRASTGTHIPTDTGGLRPAPTPRLPISVIATETAPAGGTRYGTLVLCLACQIGGVADRVRAAHRGRGSRPRLPWRVVSYGGFVAGDCTPPALAVGRRLVVGADQVGQGWPGCLEWRRCGRRGTPTAARPDQSPAPAVVGDLGPGWRSAIHRALMLWPRREASMPRTSSSGVAPTRRRGGRFRR